MPSTKHQQQTLDFETPFKGFQNELRAQLKSINPKLWGVGRGRWSQIVEVTMAISSFAYGQKDHVCRADTKAIITVANRDWQQNLSQAQYYRARRDAIELGILEGWENYASRSRKSDCLEICRETILEMASQSRLQKLGRADRQIDGAKTVTQTPKPTSYPPPPKLQTGANRCQQVQTGANRSTEHRGIEPYSFILKTHTPKNLRSSPSEQPCAVLTKDVVETTDEKTDDQKFSIDGEKQNIFDVEESKRLAKEVAHKINLTKSWSRNRASNEQRHKDRQLITKLGLLVAAGKMSESWLWSGIQAVTVRKPAPKKPAAYLQRTLAESAEQQGSKLHQLLARCRVPPP